MLETAPEYTKDDTTISLIVKLLGDGTLKNIQNDYLYWDKIKYKAKNCTPEELWNAIKLFRSINSNNIRFGKTTFSFMITDYIQRALYQLDMNIGETSASTTTDKTKLVINSIMEEAISSSQMEGASTTRKKAKEMIQQGKKPKDKSEQMIMNNYITMKYIVEHQNEDISPEQILYIHKLISNNTLADSKDEGKFRDNDDIHVVNHINGEIVHNPPLKDELSFLIRDLCDFFNKDGTTFIHPIIKSCIIHFMIAWIHPFTDGNGRTARAIFYWYMLKKGYWLTEYLST